ncbi:rhodanese-like domain-containing protein [Campylobacter sp. RM16192]|uniref:rhodanese-like domain-containing protein n=1 Tax=Campylobacter sp. RM16192 TaxID=1660080 RepID=UPI001451475A|nr:rhodanese-like domain-containing protein [Campylobacter sp. RM16192]QCD51807.1 cytochrome c family protein [Campylobacter sp. RM16192]
MYGLCMRFMILFALVISHNLFANMDSPLNFGIEGAKSLSINQAEKMLGQKDTYFVDMSSPAGRISGHIPGAILNNADDLNISLLPKDKKAHLIFYCDNRMSFDSSVAAKVAKSQGYENLYILSDGIEGWIIAGNKFEKSGKARKQLTKEKIEDYDDGIHGNMLFGKIPSCRDCHSSDKIPFASKEQREELFKDKAFVNDNCTSCHKDVKKDFMGSVHDEASHKNLAADKELPNCSDCHSVHTAGAKMHLDIKQLSEQKCGSCHEEQQKHYHDTFHGKALLLNKPGEAPRVAACFDCHGTHNVFKIEDPRSTLAMTENRIKTCSECHPNANESFVSFIAHADHTDGEKFPLLHSAYIFMTGLVIAVFAFFGFHTFLWSIRLIRMRLENPVAWKKVREAAHHDRVKVKRFSAFHMWQHFFMAASFLGLAFSGLPQKFYTAPWAQDMMNLMGGPIMATQIHHISAVIMFAVFFSHIAEIMMNLGKFKIFGEDSLMPNLQDFRDMKDHFMWFMGKGPRPQFDRWTYWEKFDYLAVFWGMFIIGLSGLILWFPNWFANFLPGWMINLSTLVHSDEALLATGFIFAIHFFNTHFRADRFPMDTVIFSGSLTAEEMRQERSKWYERLSKNGMLEKLIEKEDKFASYSLLAKLAGYAMLITGMVFLFMMIYAFIA